jgi:phage shock protein PspC (stress-responsive transcriptional regulator)
VCLSLVAGQLAWALLLALYGVVVYTVPIYVIVWCLKEEEARQAESDNMS